MASQIYTLSLTRCGVVPGIAVSQDYQVPFKFMFDLWSQKKLSHNIARTLAVQFRIMGVERFYATVNWVEERELSMACLETAVEIRRGHEEMLGNFKTTPAILEWQAQYLPQNAKHLLRFKPLLLQGGSQTGKTRKALSLYGHQETFSVNCQGLGTSVPSLREFRRSQHRAILFDECSSPQLLANKLLFQSGVDEVAMQQSATNMYSYSIWVYSIPMIICSNHFQMKGTPSAPMAEEDEEYLSKNVIDGSLPPGEKWFDAPVDYWVPEDAYCHED